MNKDDKILGREPVIESKSNKFRKFINKIVIILKDIYNGGIGR